MEIGNLGSLYLDDARFAASSLGIGRNAAEGAGKRPGVGGGAGAGSGMSFAELVEKNHGKTGPGKDGPVGRNEEPSSPGASPLKKPMVDKTSKLYEQCEALETFLIKNLVKSMRGTIQKSELIDTGFAGEIYEDMLYDEYTESLSKNAGFGFAELAYLELTGQRGKKLDLPGV
jgi:flagellar protein FlgJ